MFILAGVSKHVTKVFFLCFVSTVFVAMLSITAFLSSLFGKVTMNSKPKPSILHQKARSAVYPGSEKQRFPVKDDKVPWSSKFPDYKPTEYTAPVVLKHPVWADPDNGTPGYKSIQFNKLDGKTNRKTFNKEEYKFKGGLPQNPFGRTGIIGRGLLGKWGPNHAADPIVTRWKHDEHGKRVEHAETKKNILQFVAVQRNDNHEWAIPGGMVDNDENVSVTLKREFSEEALNSLEISQEKKRIIATKLDVLFKSGKPIYEGYVDDHRNTDNAWMETVAMNFHDETGESAGQLPLQAGDDAGNVRWMDIDAGLQLYASHIDFLEKVAQLHKAHWHSV